ncbi:hypothetical protein N7478_005390 [Penicillium angulare]|uniref:uncharacterized protein n=1 Tax=Penicillium angulare TaxID=116970 RepID=UPI0025414A83|nr:uncharacterized protein N7478_005390 [Penicillium angulare]KAJ5280018.1 hypothetical protein N7478_005390 [Penicillium angulare]
MRLLLATSLFAIPALCAGSSQSPPGKNAILLSNVKTLTLRANSMTTSRRVTPIPQLNCVGSSKKICDLYQPDTMRCSNEGYGYDEEDVQWTCEASLPPEFKLGSTDVVCEGYRNSDDNWVLRGSCGVEYRLMLTEQGEQRFGPILKSNHRKNQSNASSVSEDITNIIFCVFILGVFGVILYACCGSSTNRRPRSPRRDRGGHSGGGPGGGGGGGGGYGPQPGPPPPYGSWDKSSYSGRSSQQGWTPGFWSGALGGGAVGYGAGRYAGSGGSSSRRDNAGEGSSRSVRSQSPPTFSGTSTSTGFGSTKRR